VNSYKKKETMSSLIQISYPLPSVAQINLNRPDKRNAFNLQMLEELVAAIDSIRADPTQRVLLLTASGPAFCTGMDLNEATDAAKVEQSALLIARCLKGLYHAPLVTIAAVQGTALGGGAGLATACDIIVASQQAVFGYPEVQRGLVPAQVAALLVRQMGGRQARALLLTGETIQAERAEAFGLVNKVVSHEDLFPETLKLAKELFKCAPGAIAQTKRLLDAFDPLSFEHDIDCALSFHREARVSSEAQEGVAAFFDKRLPSWNF
jgi:methylglutaconyl-CoA hydratase